MGSPNIRRTVEYGEYPNAQVSCSSGEVGLRDLALTERSSSRNLKALLIDLNGTLHIGHEATHGAVRALERLRAARVPFVLWCVDAERRASTHL